MRNNLNNTLLSRSSGIIINSKIFFLLGGLWLLSSFLFNHPQITPIIISPEIEEIVVVSVNTGIKTPDRFFFKLFEWKMGKLQGSSFFWANYFGINELSFCSQHCNYKINNSTCHFSILHFIEYSPGGFSKLKSFNKEDADHWFSLWKIYLGYYDVKALKIAGCDLQQIDKKLLVKFIYFLKQFVILENIKNN